MSTSSIRKSSLPNFKSFRSQGSVSAHAEHSMLEKQASYRSEKPPTYQGSSYGEEEEDERPVQSIARSQWSAGMFVIFTLVAISCLGVGLYQQNDIVVSGQLSWNLSKEIQDIINAANTVSNTAENVVNTVKDTGENVLNDVKDAVTSIFKERGIDIPSFDIPMENTWKFAIALNEVKLDEGDKWPGVMNDKLWNMAKFRLTQVRSAFIASLAILSIALLFRLIADYFRLFSSHKAPGSFDTERGRSSSYLSAESSTLSKWLTSYAFGKFIALLQLVSFVLACIATVALCVIIASIPMLNFESSPDIPFVESSFETEKVNWRVAYPFIVALGFMCLHRVLFTLYDSAVKCLGRS